MKGVLLAASLLFVVMSVISTPCSRVQSVDISSGILLDNSSVIFEGVEYKDGAWYEVEESNATVRLGCPCLDRICIHRCCPRGSTFFNTSCTPTDLIKDYPFNPTLYKGREILDVVADEQFFYLYHRPCNDSYLVDSASTDEELYLQQNGTLYEVAMGASQWHPTTTYCLEMMFTDLSSSPHLVAGICFPEEEEPVDSQAMFAAYAIGLLLSVPFLLATFIIYAFVPELRNLHGMCLMAYCGGLIVAYPFLAYLKLHIGKVGIAMSGCLGVAFIVYYAFQTSFFWLNVMCFDIWRTFSGYRGSSNNKRRERRRFMLYGIYAWGVPLVLTALTAAMQFSDVPSNIITPGFGTQRCWFVDWTADLVYFYTPVFVLVICNIIFFSVTANKIRSIRQETAILKGAESSRSDKLKKDKQRYGLYLKLFVVMGVNWSVELISFAVGGSNWYWVVTDISNMGLGLFVFLIFVWKKKVRNLVQKRFSLMFNLPYTERDSRTSKWNTTSTAPTEDTRISSDDSALRLKEMH